MSQRLAVMSVIYNNYKVSEDFLRSLGKQNNKNFHLFISDLSDQRSPEGSPFGHPSGVEITIIKDINQGYAYGVNLGLKKAIKAGFHYFCIVNNDIYFKENFIESVLSSIINHPSSIIGGKIYYAPGYEYHRGRYQKYDLGKVFWYAGGRVDWNHALTPHRGVDEIDHGQFNKFAPTDFINGCLMIFDKTVIDKVGFWDENYFLYFEDADYCQRAKNKGIKLYYDPSIVLWHKNAQSTDGAGSNLHQSYQEKNRLRFGLKYAPLRTKIHLIKNYLLRLWQRS